MERKWDKISGNDAKNLFALLCLLRRRSWNCTLLHPTQSWMARSCSQTCPGAVDCSSLTWKGRQAREMLFIIPPVPRRSGWRESGPHCCFDIRIADNEFSAHRCAVFLPQSPGPPTGRPTVRPGVPTAGSYRNSRTPLPPCVLSHSGQQSGFSPQKASCLAEHTAL